MLLRGLVLAAAVLPAAIVVGAEKSSGDIETRRERREREQFEFLLTSLLKTRIKREPQFFHSANSPTRCAEIEFYLRTHLKMRAEIKELALLVEAHDPKLVPTRVYRVKYEDRKGKSHEHDFLMQQHGADWLVEAHLPALEIRLAEPPPQELPPQEFPQ